MSAIAIRNLPDAAHEGLRRLAKARGTSVEALAREALIAVAQPKSGAIDFARLGAARAAMGLAVDQDRWPADFDDPALSREVLGLYP
jgi:plasmid stability protein